MHSKDWKIKVGIVIEHKGKALLIREWSNKKNGYFWNIIKGTYGDIPNESIVECALRECREEAGADVTIGKFLHCATSVTEKGLRLQFNFVGTCVSIKLGHIDRDKQKSQGEDIKEVKWFSKAELKKINNEEFINNRSYKAIQQWLSGNVYDISVMKEIHE